MNSIARGADADGGELRKRITAGHGVSGPAVHARIGHLRRAMSYMLLGADGSPYLSDARGHWGGHRSTRIYGGLDCPSALRAIARGGYVRHRVFFADEVTAIAAGYRPCAICCPDRYHARTAAR